MDFAGFFPSGPLTSLYALVLLVVTVPVIRWGRRPINDVALILLCGWLLARATTWIDIVHLQAFGTIALIFALWCVGGRVALYILGLCCLKLITYSLHLLDVVNLEQMWAISEVFGYLQLVVLFGGTFHGSGVGSHPGLSLYRSGYSFPVFGLSERMQSVRSARRSRN